MLELRPIIRDWHFWKILSEHYLHLLPGHCWLYTHISCSLVNFGILTKTAGDSRRALHVNGNCMCQSTVQPSSIQFRVQSPCTYLHQACLHNQVDIPLQASPVCTLLVVRNSKLVFKLRYVAECHVSFYSLRYNQIGTAGAESLGTALKECTKLESLE